MVGTFSNSIKKSQNTPFEKEGKSHHMVIFPFEPQNPPCGRKCFKSLYFDEGCISQMRETI